jgi:hypothetical protein
MQPVEDMCEKEKDALKEVLYEMHKEWRWSIGSNIDFSCPNPIRDFYIQFTTLKWNKYEYEWELKSLIGVPELIYDPDVEYAEEQSVLLKSWKNNWDDFHLCWTRELQKNEILLSSLYSDFTNHNYTGECWMR